MDAEKLRFRKGDWLAVVLVVIAAVAVMLCFLPGSSDPAAVVQIYLDGELIKTLPLSENWTFVVEEQYSNEITVRDGAVRFTASTCPGQD